MDDDAAGYALLVWNDATYMIEIEDHTTLTHDENYEIVTCVGEWFLETKTLNLD